MIAAHRQICTFYLDKYLFGVDAYKVQEVIRYQAMTQIPLTPDYVSGLINLRGQIVTAIDMRKRMGLKPRSDDRLPMNVVIRNDEGAVSLLVDQIGDVIDANSEVFEQPPETLQGKARDFVEGTYKLDGRLLLLLNTSDAIRDGD